METIFSAAMGELAARSISFLIDRYLKPAKSKEESIQRLQMMILRVRLTIEEAEGRCITNQAMLWQLHLLRNVMYRGSYMLDTFIQQLPEEEDKDHGVSRSLSLSRFNPAKRVCFSAGSKYGMKELEQMLESVEITVAGMSEFVVFLRNYPPMFRQPYSSHLFTERCIFGRQMEMDRVINFLLHEEPPSESNIGVLPIVGPGKVGKTTLVEHACFDERVRNHFSRIIFLSENDFREASKGRDEGRIKHQHSESNDEKFLLIIEQVGHFDESSWKQLHSASQCSIPAGSKIIITSQSENIASFGTTRALSLKLLSREAYWYYFKVLVFGSVDLEGQPKLASIAMEILDELFDQDKYARFTGLFLNLKYTAYFLRASIGVHSWRRILGFIKDNRKQNESLSRKGLNDFGAESDRIFLRRVSETAQFCVFQKYDGMGHEKEEAPKVSLLETISGSVSPHGKFDVLIWKSHLPAYHKHIYSCEILESENNATRNKQGPKRKTLS
ncbi:hypothetical protein ACP70R_014629 [Stipagrostis hirtigluma subsp. patula]